MNLSSNAACKARALEKFLLLLRGEKDCELHSGAHLSLLSALCIADLLLREDSTRFSKERKQLATRCYHVLWSAAYPAGNIMEACRLKWVVDRLISLKTMPSFCARCVAPEYSVMYACLQFQKSNQWRWVSQKALLFAWRPPNVPHSYGYSA